MKHQTIRRLRNGLLSAGIIAFLTGCATGVKYIPAEGVSVSFPEDAQPVYLEVVDSRKSDRIVKEVNEAPEPGVIREVKWNEAPSTGVTIKESPRYLVGLALEELFRSSGVRQDERSNSRTEVMVHIRFFDVLLYDNDWTARVSLEVISGNKSQKIDAIYTRYNLLGTRDAQKALSEALSRAVNSIKWETLL